MKESIPDHSPYRWYALKVRAGGEVRLAASLMRKAFEIFLPSYVEIRKYSDRLKKVEAALFPGYLFARLDVSHRLPILVTPGVDSIVSIGGIPEPIDDMTVEGIRRIVESGEFAVPWPFLRAGDPVQIVSGPLSGVEGFLLKARDKTRLVVSIDMLQRSISIEIDRHEVRPLDQGAGNTSHVSKRIASRV
jgi:transcription antitermination factor NusG